MWYFLKFHVGVVLDYADMVSTTSLTTQTRCWRSQRLPRHSNDYADTFGKLWRLLTDFKGTIRQKSTCNNLKICWLCRDAIFDLKIQYLRGNETILTLKLKIFAERKNFKIRLSKKQRERISGHCPCKETMS